MDFFLFLFISSKSKAFNSCNDKLLTYTNPLINLHRDEFRLTEKNLKLLQVATIDRGLKVIE